MNHSCSCGCGCKIRLKCHRNGRVQREISELPIDIALYIAALNIAAVGLATVEFSVGIDRFFPRNETTEIIYKSRDLLGHAALFRRGVLIRNVSNAKGLQNALRVSIGAPAANDAFLAALRAEVAP